MTDEQKLNYLKELDSQIKKELKNGKTFRSSEAPKLSSGVEKLFEFEYV